MFDFLIAATGSIIKVSHVEILMAENVSILSKTDLFFNFNNDNNDIISIG